MKKKILASKELGISPDLYSGYPILNLYEEQKALNRGPNKIHLYGLFLSDIPARIDQSHGNEVHFPIVFTDKTKAEALFAKMATHVDINAFVHSLDALIGL